MTVTVYAPAGFAVSVVLVCSVEYIQRKVFQIGVASRVVGDGIIIAHSVLALRQISMENTLDGLAYPLELVHQAEEVRLCLLVAALLLNAQLCRIVQTWLPSVLLRGVPGTHVHQ